MSRVLVNSFASAALGAVLGAGAISWWLSSSTTDPASHGDEATLEKRVAAVEHTLSTIEPAAQPVPALAATVPDPSLLGVTEPPVFQTAEISIVERADDARDRERIAVKEEKRRQRNRYWANDLTMRLGLTPAQTERLLAIQTRLEENLDQEPNNASARRLMRQTAEEQLRGVLAPRQLDAYQTLDPRLKLDRQGID